MPELVQLINPSLDESEAPFAVSEADRAATFGAPSKVNGAVSWSAQRPALVGVVTGVICFTIVAGAIFLARTRTDVVAIDDPVVGASANQSDANRSSISDGGSGSNFTSNEAKRRSRATGAKSDNDNDHDDEVALPAADRGDVTADDDTSEGQDATDSNPETESNTSDTTSDKVSGAPTTAANTGPTIDPKVGLDPRGPTSLVPGPGDQTSPRPSTSTTRRQISTSAKATSTTRRTTSTTRSPTTSATPSTATSTTRRTTTSRPPTTPSTSRTTTTATTTTTTSTTSPPPVGDLVIASPSDGGKSRYDIATTFAVNAVPGATRYCWRLTQSGSSGITNRCSSGTTYRLPANSAGLRPGLVTVEATAEGPFGERSDNISMWLVRDETLQSPKSGSSEKHGKNLRTSFHIMRGATQYCVRLRQSGYLGEWRCSASKTVSFKPNDKAWDDIEPGSLTIESKVRAGTRTLDTDTISVTITGKRK